MAKGRKTAALAALGLGAAALSGMFDKKGKKDEDSKDTTADASAGMAKDRLGAAGLDMGDKDTTSDMSSGMAKDRLADLEKAKTRARKGSEESAKAPVRQAPARKPANISDASVPTAANRTGVNENARDMILARNKEETGAQRIARKQEAGRDKMVGAYRSAFGFKKGGSVSSASKRADGCAVKGKTKGRMV